MKFQAIMRLIYSKSHWGREEGISSECPRFAVHHEACLVVDVANLGHKDWIPSSLPQCGDYFPHSCLKMCKIAIKHTLDTTFLDCLALMFCDFIRELLPEWACLILQGGTTFHLTSILADIPVSRVRIHTDVKGYDLVPTLRWYIVTPVLRISSSITIRWGIWDSIITPLELPWRHPCTYPEMIYGDSRTEDVVVHSYKVWHLRLDHHPPGVAMDTTLYLPWDDIWWLPYWGCRRPFL